MISGRVRAWPFKLFTLSLEECGEQTQAAEFSDQLRPPTSTVPSEPRRIPVATRAHAELVQGHPRRASEMHATI